MILEGASPRLHPSKTLTTRTILDLSLPWVIERSDAPILNLSPKEQTRVHNLINDPSHRRRSGIRIRTSKTRAPYISNTMVGKGASRGSVGHAAVLLDRIRANARISLQAKAASKKRARKRRASFARCKDLSSPDAAQSWLFPLSVSVSRRRPRASRDMTVPIGTSVV